MITAKLKPATATPLRQIHWDLVLCRRTDLVVVVINTCAKVLVTAHAARLATFAVLILLIVVVAVK